MMDGKTLTSCFKECLELLNQVLSDSSINLKSCGTRCVVRQPSTHRGDCGNVGSWLHPKLHILDQETLRRNSRPLH